MRLGRFLLLRQAASPWRLFSTPPTPRLLGIAAAIQAPPTASQNVPAVADEKLARVTCSGCHAFPALDLPRDRLRRGMSLGADALHPRGPGCRLGHPRRSIQRSSPAGHDDGSCLLPGAGSGAIAGARSLARSRRHPDRVRASHSIDDRHAADACRVEPVDWQTSTATESWICSGPTCVRASSSPRVQKAGQISSGTVTVECPRRFGSPRDILAEPVARNFCRLRRDSIKDILVGDMGAFFPADHKKGAVIRLKGMGKAKFSAVTWLDDWPRVADVERPTSMATARTIPRSPPLAGGRQECRDPPSRTRRRDRPASLRDAHDRQASGIHPRHPAGPQRRLENGPRRAARPGARDGARLHQYRQGRFHVRQKGEIYAPPHPDWGSSGIQPVDLKDGDLDVLLTHGDTFTTASSSPMTTVPSGLENKGASCRSREDSAGADAGSGTARRPLTGRRTAIWISSACALLASGSDVDDSSLPALVWLEQTRPGAFVRHTIEMDATTCDARSRRHRQRRGRRHRRRQLLDREADPGVGRGLGESAIAQREEAGARHFAHAVSYANPQLIGSLGKRADRKPPDMLHARGIGWRQINRRLGQ